MPTRGRNVSAVALRLPQRSELWLFDCGEGTQHQFLKSELRTSQLRRIFITHMHGDHVYGLPGLLASIGLAGSSSGIELYGPAPLKNFIDACLYNSSSRLAYSLNCAHTAIQPLLLLFHSSYPLFKSAVDLFNSS